MGLLKYEVSSKPWFGPRSRAKEFLSKYHGEAFSPEAFVSYFEKHPKLGNKVQFLRFVDFVHSKDRFRYRIVIIWSHSDPDIRQTLYEMAGELVSTTGWYVLPQGERLGLIPSSQATTVETLASLAADDTVVELQSIESAVPYDGGCCIRVGLSNGKSILLDSGFDMQPFTSDSLVLLTHIHRDHSGSVVQGNCDGLQIVSSVATKLLIGEALKSETSIDAINIDESYSLGGGIELGCFSVPHLPGAVAFWIEDRKTRIIFTGDISLKTSRHNFIPELSNRLSSDKKNIVLLDATMAGRDAGASRENTGKIIADDDSDICVVGESPEHLLYAYVDLYHAIQKSEKRHSVSFICPAPMKKLFRLLHTPFMLRDLKSLDVFLYSQYGKSMSAWAESRWLYWSEFLKTLPDGRRLFFVGLNQVDDFANREDLKIVYIGRPAKRPDDRRVWNVDTTPWTLHSDSTALAEATSALVALGAKVAFFHNMPRRMKKFISTEMLEADMVRYQHVIEL